MFLSVFHDDEREITSTEGAFPGIEGELLVCLLEMQVAIFVEGDKLVAIKGLFIYFLVSASFHLFEWKVHISLFISRNFQIVEKIITNYSKQ